MPGMRDVLTSANLKRLGSEIPGVMDKFGRWVRYSRDPEADSGNIPVLDEQGNKRFPVRGGVGDVGEAERYYATKNLRDIWGPFVPVGANTAHELLLSNVAQETGGANGVNESRLRAGLQGSKDKGGLSGMVAKLYEQYLNQTINSGRVTKLPPETWE